MCACAQYMHHSLNIEIQDCATRNLASLGVYDCRQWFISPVLLVRGKAGHRSSMSQEEAAAEESRKIRAQKLRQQQQQQQQMDDSHQQHEAPRPLQTQRRTSNPRRPTAIRGQAPPKEKCSIM